MKSHTYLHIGACIAVCSLDLISSSGKLYESIITVLGSSLCEKLLLIVLFSLGGQQRARLVCRAACLIAVAAPGSCPDVPPDLMLPDGAAVVGSLDLCAVRALPGEVLIGERPSTRCAQNLHK